MCDITRVRVREHVRSDVVVKRVSCPRGIIRRRDTKRRLNINNTVILYTTTFVHLPFCRNTFCPSARRLARPVVLIRRRGAGDRTHTHARHAHHYTRRSACRDTRAGPTDRPTDRPPDGTNRRPVHVRTRRTLYKRSPSSRAWNINERGRSNDTNLDPRTFIRKL